MTNQSLPLATFTVQDIQSWDPCYSPHEFIPIGWRGTALDILEIKSCPAQDRLWVVQRPQCIPVATARVHALWVIEYTFGQLSMNQEADKVLLSQVVAAIENMNQEGSGDAVNRNALVRNCFQFARASSGAKMNAWHAAQYALGGGSKISTFRYPYHTTREASKAIGHDMKNPVSRNEFYDIAADALIGMLKEV